MKIRKILTRRGMAGFGIAALAAGVLASVPTAANALPNVQVDETINFGTVAVGDSVDRTITITNAGTPGVPEDIAVQFQAFAFPNFDPQFTLLNPFCIDNGLEGGESCNTISYRFTPTSSAPAVQTVQINVAYQQDVDPGPGQNFQPVQRQFTITLVANVTCGGQAATIFGTPGDDEIAGTAGNDVIATFDGNDIVKADGGNDIVCGGDDSDTLKGGKGKDKLYGEGGSDILKGGKATDTCIGGLGVDRAKKCEKVGSL